MSYYTKPIRPTDNIRKWNTCSDKMLEMKRSIGRREGVSKTKLDWHMGNKQGAW